MNPATRPMPSRLTHVQRSEATRHQLIAATIEVVREKSYQGATVFEVAKSAGVTPGALQHHFGSKAVLMMEVIDEILRPGGSAEAEWPSVKLPLARRASQYVKTLWEEVYEPPRFLVAWSVYFGCSANPELLDQIARRREALAESLHQRFQSIFPEATGSTGVNAFVDLVLSSLRGIGTVRLFSPQRTHCAEQLQALTDVIVARCTTSTESTRSRSSTGNSRSQS